MLSRVWLFCDPVDCSLPGSSVHGILQARILEWVAIPFSRSSLPRDWTWVSCTTGRFFTIWATREALFFLWLSNIPLYTLLHLYPFFCWWMFRFSDVNLMGKLLKPCFLSCETELLARRAKYMKGQRTMLQFFSK